jgi:DNA-binding protein H-NS
MKSLVDIQSEIESLTAQASQLRAKDFDRTLKDIVATMRAFGITVAQVRDALQSASKSRGKVGRPKAAKGKPGRKPKAAAAKKAPKGKAGGARKPAPIKFRGPNGEAWSGRGKLPKWLKAATNAGQSMEAFRV